MKSAVLFVLISIVGIAIAVPGLCERNDGIDLIDNHRYEDAIQLYSGRIRKNPEDAESRVLLASTYAARNGIVLSRFIGVAQVIMAGPSQKQQSGLSAMLAQMNIALKAIVVLPDLSGPAAVADLRAAVEVMTDSPGASYGYYLYRAILRLVILKDDLRHQNVLSPSAGSCAVTEAAMQGWLELLARGFVPVIEDVAKGTKNPARRASILTSKAKLGELVAPAGGDAPSQTELIEIPPPLRGLYPC